MKTKCAFWVAGVGVLLGAALRCIQMLFFFDYDTGFVTDSGVLTILYSGVTLVAAVVSGVLCLADRRRCGSLLRGRSWSAGVSALLVGVFLLLCAAALFWDAYIYRAFGVSYFVLPSQVGAHVPFAVFTALFGAAAVAAAVLWMRGKAFPGKAGVLWALGVVWGVGYMLLTFMLYSASATTVENLYTVGGGAAMLFFLLAEGKLLSGVGGAQYGADGVRLRAAGRRALADLRAFEHRADRCRARLCHGDAVRHPARDARGLHPYSGAALCAAG